MKLIYPACFYPCEEGGYTVVFPDLPGCVTEGDTLADAMEMAVDASSGWLLTSVEENNQLPKASNIKNVIPDEYENGFVSLIGVDLEEYSQKHGNKAIKKTLTIPAWLNTIAEVNNVNFSQVLQNALKDQLGINN
ncbi:MAG: type II toxin-antitoxin system HicB family antitoxin [Desulfitobacteriaceae bacterium]